ncbi:phosphatase 2C-like domain-containing protein [Mycena crocata]|nr:phosphatase 2C-like domain-containing protein [Mycena crocata]
MRNNSGIALGVADGVGGWIDQGIDCSMFSQALMYYAHGHFETGWAGERESDPIDSPEDTIYEGVEMTPSECMQLSYLNVLEDESVVAGSSTACLLTLNASSGLLRSANLGDSGFTIIRNSSVLYSSTPQTHYFNCPRQLAKLPGRQGGRVKDSIRDPPTAAKEYSTKLRDGDIIISYTDGLSDNIFSAEMLEICTLAMKSQVTEATQVQMIAEGLVHFSRVCMFNNRTSPFEIEARQNRKLYKGGKVDDVTVLVALVRETT